MPTCRGAVKRCSVICLCPQSECPSAGCPCCAQVRWLAGHTLLSGSQIENGLAVSLLETCLTSVCDSVAFVAVL